MTTTDREDLYQQAIKTFHEPGWMNSLSAIRAVVDLALDARSDRQPWEVLREAADIYDGGDPEPTLTAENLRREAARLEAKLEKLIEQAAWIAAATRDRSMSDFRAYGREFTYDTETRGVVGGCDGGEWWVPAWRQTLAEGVYSEVWDRRLNPRNPLHWRYMVKSWITGRVALLERVA